MMSVKQRILTIRLIEKIRDDPEYAEKIGVAVKDVADSEE